MKKKVTNEMWAIYILSLVVVAVISVVITYSVVTSKYDKQIEELNKAISEMESMTTEEANEIESVSDEEYTDRLKNSKGVEFESTGELVSPEDSYREEASDCFMNVIDYLSNENLYLATQVSDEGFDTYMYNKSGEMFVEHSLYGTNTIRLNDNRQYLLHDGHWSYSEDLDVLTLMRVVADKIKDDKTTVYKVDTSEYEVKSYEGSVILNGWQEVYDFYSNVSAEYAELLVKQLMASTSYDISVEFSYGFTINNEITFSVFVIMPAEEGSEDPVILTNWSMNGYEIIDDWSLNNDWYSMFESEDCEYNELLNSTYEQLAELLNITVNDTENNAAETESSKDESDSIDDNTSKEQSE